jgi:nitrous oxidase accessory protein NosD
VWQGYRKVSLIVVLLFVLSAFQIAVTILPVNVSATTHFVGGSGLGNYTKIQDAIDDADPGDAIYVYSGTYAEHLNIRKTLSLQGESAETTIIDGGGTSNVVFMRRSDWTNISGFTMRNSAPSVPGVGIALNSVENCTVAGNILLNNAVGIDLIAQ